MKSIDEIQSVAVLGAGTMGNGIAQISAQAGWRTRLYDIEEAFVAKGMERIQAMLQKAVDRGKMDEEGRARTLELLSTTCDLEEAVSGVDLVIEAIPERMELKKEVFARVASLVAEDCLLATNTSSLSVTEIAGAVPGPERFLGMHYFNPPPIMKLCEIVRGEKSSDETVALAREIALRQGREPIVVKDRPGFASSRLGLILGLEAIRMVEEEVASPEDIDKAMKLGYRHPMGPLELTDLVGLDVRLSIAKYLAKTLDDRRFAPPALLERMVAEGKLGKKSGEGFYKW
ncbi:MAG TPA: 3-hydroxyacyl-CoA dehydrogenase family protein [Planctomycetes bacterium]|nr:3-hydroxyacyl-CoA dehydrogenase family protein [Planctomycetota bacterium]